MVVALAGRRVDAQDAEQVRFPLDNTDAVARRLECLFRELEPQVLVCSAACGADLLALKVARDLGVRRRIVLPFEGSRFRSTSVVDRPGEWGLLFDALYEEALDTDDLIVTSIVEDDDTAYAAATELIVQEASSLASEVGLQAPAADRSTEERVAVVVWEGASRGDGDQTAHFAALAQGQGFRIIEVDTLRVDTSDRQGTGA